MKTAMDPGTDPTPNGRAPGGKGRRLHVRAGEVEVRTRRGRTALILVPGTMDRRAVWMLATGAGLEQAELADLHAGPELDRQGSHDRQLKGHVAGEAGIDPAGGGVCEQAEPSETRFPF